MELNKAYKIFDIQRDCTLDELNERYDFLLLREQDINKIDEIHEAYEKIHTYLSPADDQNVSFQQKLKDFFYVHKYMIVFGTIAVVLVGSILFAVVSNYMTEKQDKARHADSITIAIFGNFVEEDFSSLENKLSNLLTGQQSIQIELVYSPKEINSEFDTAAIQKGQIYMATEKPDIYILDHHNYESFIEKNLLLDMDELYSIYDSTKSSEDILFTFDPTNEHVYGVELTDNDIFKGMINENQEKIATIRFDSQKSEDAIQLLSKVLNLQ